MNDNFNEINDIIVLCDKMSDYIKSKGNIFQNNTLYCDYKEKINTFLKKNHLNKTDYAPYAILNKFYFTSLSYSVNQSEINAIRESVVKIKHEQFSEHFENIFISHREKDKEQIASFIELLYALGIKRPTKENPERSIFCSSHPDCYIENGIPNLETIRNELNSDKHTFYILWYTDNYFQSQSCLNEAGAIWVLEKKYQEILMPDFNETKIRGLLDKQPVWFRSNDKFRLNIFKEQIGKMFSLPELTANSWESARDKFINEINSFSKKIN